MINFYNQFYKRSIPVFNNKKQDKVAFIEEKRTELPNNLRQANGFAKSMQYHNNQYKKDKFNINNTSKQNNIPIVQKTQTTIFNNIISNIQTWIKN